MLVHTWTQMNKSIWTILQGKINTNKCSNLSLMEKIGVDLITLSLLALWLFDGCAMELESLFGLLGEWLRVLRELAGALDIQDSKTSSNRAPTIYRHLWTTCITVKKMTARLKKSTFLKKELTFIWMGVDFQS